MPQPFRVLLYYNFVLVEDPVALAEAQLAFCSWLGLKGRIIVASEGINGTLSGSQEACDEYIAAHRSDRRFSDTDFKVDEYDRHAFRRLSVKARDEIVTFGHALHDPSRTGTYLSPVEFRERLADPNAIIVDGRNDYEYDLGHFRGAIRPDFENFKEAPAWLSENLHDRDRPILTYCTGGIRCEKLSAFLLEQGFTNVFQLHGGIVEYGKDPAVKGDLFDGACFVFDERISVPINRTESARVVGRCLHCGAPSENYVNCANVLCNQLYLCCETCEAATDGCCCPSCQNAPARRKKGLKLRSAPSRS